MMNRISIYKIFVVFFICIFFPNSLIFSNTRDKQAKLTLSTTMSSLKIHEQVILLAQVSDQQGNPIPNQKLIVSSEGVSGRFLTDTQDLRTDENGQVKNIWQAGQKPGKVAISISLVGYSTGFTQQAIQEITVNPDPKAELNGRVVIRMTKECALGTVIEVYDKTNQLVTTLNADEDGLFDTGCTLICNDTYLFKPIKANCSFSPAQMHLTAKCCPDSTSFVINCDCGTPNQAKIRVIIPPSCISGTVIKIFDQSGKEVAILANPTPEGVYESPCYLFCDQDYKAMPVNPKCQFYPTMLVKRTVCCPGVSTVTFNKCSCTDEPKEGRILVKMYEYAITNTIVRISTVDGVKIMDMEPPPPNSPEDTTFNTGCVLKCGVLYRVEAINPNCTFSPAILYTYPLCCDTQAAYPVNFTIKCSENSGGKIRVKIPKSWVGLGTMIAVEDILTDAQYASFDLREASSEGIFDSMCMFRCGKIYKVRPINDNYTFNPPFKTVMVKCCPDFGFVDFTTPEIGKIKIKIASSCLKGTKINVLDNLGKLVEVLTAPSSDGIFETKCTLKLGATYKVIPLNQNCQFTPPYLDVVAIACSETAYVSFNNCTCSEPPKDGKLIIKLPPDKAKDTVMQVSLPDGTQMMLLKPDANGVYDTGCELICGELYKIEPKNSKCKFTPATQSVKASCCSDKNIIPITFQATCEPSKTGKISVKVPTSNLVGTTIIIRDTTGILITTISTPNANGVFETKCSLNCDVSYTVTPTNGKFVFTPLTATVTAKCCPDSGLVTFTATGGPGKIVVRLPENSVKDTIVNIKNIYGQIVSTITTPNIEKLFETTCSLVCGKSYIVEPINKSCIFSPTTITIPANCCPEFGLATFDAIVKNGKILIKLPLSSFKGTTIYIRDKTGTLIPTVTTPNLNGEYFETTCSLICDDRYTVQPSNPNITFTPISQTVIAKCCPESGQVTFTSTSPPAKTGKIAIKIPPNCLTGTKITVTEMNGANPFSITSTNSQGVFESTCTLVCGATYKVTPTNPTCKFTPSYQTVVAKCCPEVGLVTFTTCTCPPVKTGKIKVQIPVSSVFGTKIYLIDSKGVTTILTNGNSSTGVFESPCNLLCDETYTVQPVNSSYTFTPASLKVVAKCCPSFGSATFASKKKTTFFSLIDLFLIEKQKPNYRPGNNHFGYLWSKRFDLDLGE